MKTASILIISFLICLPAAASDTAPAVIGWDGTSYHAPETRCKIGLVLSGGGARGLAQLGILKAFEETDDLAVSGIAGTSMGGIVGGLYASGYSADSLISILGQVDFSGLFSNRPARTSMFLTQRPEKDRYILSLRFDGFKPHIPKALTAGQKLNDLLISLTLEANYLCGGDFSHLPVPFHPVATDIVTGREIIIDRGNLIHAMRATMAFPLAFTGVETDGMILMDGGIVSPIPVDAIPGGTGDYDLIVAVNTTSDLLPEEKITDPIDIANQVTTIMSLDKIKAGLDSADYVITPSLEDYVSTDFKQAGEIIDLGYQAAREALPGIRRKIKEKNSFNPAVVADNSRLWNDTAVYAESQEEYPEAIPPAIRKQAALAAADLYETGRFLSVSFKYISHPDASSKFGGAIIEIDTIPAPYLDSVEIRLRGNTIFHDSAIMQIINSLGPRLNGITVKKLCDRLKDLYTASGYDLAHVRRAVYDEPQGIFEIQIDEAIIERIDIDGNRRTKKWLISSALPINEGEPFNSRQISRGIHHIYGTDLFDYVSANVLPGDSGALVRISVVEKKYLQARLGWHWHDEYKSEEFVELLDDNLLGTGQELLAHAQYAPRRRIYEMSLKADRFFSTYLTYKIEGYYGFLDRALFDADGEETGRYKEDRLGIEFVLGQQIRRFGTITGEIRWEEIEGESSLAAGREKTRLRTITLRSLVETINRYSFPTEGKRHLFYIEFAADVLGGETNYTKIYSSVESYFPLTDRINFHPALAAGWTGTDHEIPFPQRFFIGGRRSFFGLRTDELVGYKMVLANLDLRFRVPWDFYLSGRYDVGDVFSSTDNIKLRNLRHGYGFAVAHDSPIGPIDVAWGKVSEHSDQFYINIGLSF